MRDKCVVCLEETLTFPRSCCNAHVCDTCMNRHVTTQVTSGVWNVTCPGEGCGAKLQEEEILALLQETETREMYEKLKVDSNAVPNTKTCPNCKLITTLPPRRIVRARHQHNGLVITCSNCAFDWCFQCHGPAHPGVTCVARTETEFEGWAGDKLYGEFANAVQCPQCKTYVQHGGGCNNMTCTVCGKEFCYLCGDQACHHDGYVFGRRARSLLTLESFDTDTDFDLDFDLDNRIRHVLAELGSPAPACQAGSCCCVWFWTLCDWLMNAFEWAEGRTTKAGKMSCGLLVIFAALLLVLLFPLSAPVSLLIFVTMPRSRHGDTARRAELMDRYIHLMDLQDARYFQNVDDILHRVGTLHPLTLPCGDGDLSVSSFSGSADSNPLDLQSITVQRSPVDSTLDSDSILDSYSSMGGIETLSAAQTENVGELEPGRCSDDFSTVSSTSEHIITLTCMRTLSFDDGITNFCYENEVSISVFEGSVQS